MNKIKIIAFTILMATSLYACGEAQNLADISTAVNDDYTAIIWEERTYVPFCVVSKSECGALIGYVNGDTDDRVCEYKDYPTAEWIANYLTVDGGALLYKEVNADDIPDGLQSEYEWNNGNTDGIL